MFVIFTLGFATITNLNAASEQSVSQPLEQLNKKQLKSAADYPVDSFTIQDSVLTFSGKVLESDGDTKLLGVNVILKGTKIGTQTDVDGNFKLEISSENLQGQNPVLVFSFIGYAKKEVEFLPASKEHLEIEMTPELIWIGEIHIPWYRRIWWTITSPFRKS